MLVDEGLIPHKVLNGKISQKTTREAYSVLGPATVSRIMDRLFELDQKFEHARPMIGEAEREEFQRLSDAMLASRQTSFFSAMKVRARTDQPRQIQLMADLFARHGRKYVTDSPDIVDKERDELVVIVLDWIEVMLTSPDANRHQFADVARAAERLGDSRFVPGLQKMLERDFSEWAKAREAYFKAKSRGPLTSDESASYVLQYRRAFAAIGGSEVCDLMKQYLPSEQFGFDAACALVDIWRRENPSGKESQFGIGRDFSEVKERWRRKQDAEYEMLTCDSAEAIFAVVEEFGTPGSSDTAQRHALRLAALALSIPHGSKREVVDRLLALPQPSSLKQVLLRSVASSGEVLPADVLLIGVKELLEIAENQPWRLGADNYVLMEWIELFAFSDRPLAVLEALELLHDRLREPLQLRRLIIALSDSPNEDVVEVLLALEKQNQKLLDGPDWWRALGDIETEEASHAILNIVCERHMGDMHREISGWELSETLAKSASKFPAFRDEAICRYQGYECMLGTGRTRKLLLPRPLMDTIILALVHSYTPRKVGLMMEGSLRLSEVSQLIGNLWKGSLTSSMYLVRP